VAFLISRSCRIMVDSGNDGGFVSDILCCVLTVEEGGCLLECAVLSLHNEEVTEEELKCDPNDINDIILPPNMRQSDRINVLIKDQTERDRKVEYVETFGTDSVGQDLNGVGDDERRESNVVESVEEEDECDDGVAGCFVVVEGELGGADCLEEEHDHHAGGWDEEERSPSSAFDE